MHKMMFPSESCNSVSKGTLPNPVGRKEKTSFRLTNALIAFFCSSFKMNALSMSSKTSLSTHISALQRQPCLLKTISTQVTWLITLRLIICPSSYKARPDNLIGLIKFLIRHNFSPTEQCQTELPDLKFCGRG